MPRVSSHSSTIVASECDLKELKALLDGRGVGMSGLTKIDVPEEWRLRGSSRT